MKTKTVILKGPSVDPMLGSKFIVFPASMDEGFTFWEKDKNPNPNHNKNFWRRKDVHNLQLIGFTLSTLSELHKTVKHFPGLKALKAL